MNLLNYIRNLSTRPLLLLAALASAAALAAALVSEYGFHLHPCELCMAQRYPYAAIMVLAGAAAAFVRSPKTLWRLGLAVGLLFVLDAGIAAYHAGVEWHWFPGPAACTNTESANATLEEMRRAIMNAPLVACDEAAIRLLGLSMAGWNAIYAALLALATFVTLGRIRER